MGIFVTFEEKTYLLQDGSVLQFCTFAVAFCVKAKPQQNLLTLEGASEVTKMKLKEGLVMFLDEMCNGKSIDRNVMKRICIPASNIEMFSRCSTCDAYVDPMCMTDCPQFLITPTVDLKSRCSTCDAYVDPMCMVDCPQFMNLQ